jgi:hypothetical protein
MSIAASPATRITRQSVSSTKVFCTTEGDARNSNVACPPGAREIDTGFSLCPGWRSRTRTTYKPGGSGKSEEVALKELPLAPLAVGFAADLGDASVLDGLVGMISLSDRCLSQYMGQYMGQ